MESDNQPTLSGDNKMERAMFNKKAERNVILIEKAIMQSAHLAGATIARSSIRDNRVRFVFCCIGHANRQTETLKQLPVKFWQCGTVLIVRHMTSDELKRTQ
ncbi:MAG: hypothetical protein ABIO63_08955 [Casimicrobiaceae bacterium]